MEIFVQNDHGSLCPHREAIGYHNDKRRARDGPDVIVRYSTRLSIDGITSSSILELVEITNVLAIAAAVREIANLSCRSHPQSVVAASGVDRYIRLILFVCALLCSIFGICEGGWAALPTLRPKRVGERGIKEKRKTSGQVQKGKRQIGDA